MKHYSIYLPTGNIYVSSIRDRHEQYYYLGEFLNEIAAISAAKSIINELNETCIKLADYLHVPFTPVIFSNSRSFPELISLISTHNILEFQVRQSLVK